MDSNLRTDKSLSYQFSDLNPFKLTNNRSGLELWASLTPPGTLRGRLQSPCGGAGAHAVTYVMYVKKVLSGSRE